MYLTYIAVALLGINCLLLGAIIGVLFVKPKSYKAPPTKVAVRSSEEPIQPLNMEELEKRKEKLAAENEAFQRLMGYNTDMAYGIRDKGGGEA